MLDPEIVLLRHSNHVHFIFPNHSQNYTWQRDAAALEVAAINTRCSARLDARRFHE